MFLPSDVAALIARLQKHGFAAYAVGGCVRDSLRGVVPHDWDVTTAATPEQITAVFADHRTITVGAQHGTVAVVTDERTVEITTFRTESGYTDSRHPDTVTFVADINADLARRDFTVNAMAYNEQDGLADPFGGQEDLANGILRCVGDAVTRFSEDALRILRGLRFAATLPLRIAPETAHALHETRDRLHNIAAERIAVELTKLLCGQNVLPVLQEYRDVLAVVIPEIAATFDFDQRNPHHCYDVYMHTLHAIDAAPSDPIVRWAVLLHDIGKPHTFTVDEDGIGHFKGHAAVGAPMAEEILTRLRMSRDTVQTVTTLVKAHDRQIPPTEPAVKRALGRFGESLLRDLIAVKHADNDAHALYATERRAQWQAVETVLNRVSEKEACFSLKDLAVKGSDITALGVSAGPIVGKILKHLLNEVIDGQIENDRHALLTRLHALLNEGVFF
ncbi:MAG: HD domain-containing protein [Ruminococcaceae bacterium]|nr:HD domain-containing protein [Oscillospiraceae bacterium]